MICAIELDKMKTNGLDLTFHQCICQSPCYLLTCKDGTVNEWLDKAFTGIHSKQTYARPPTAPPFLNLISHKGLSHLPENISVPQMAACTRNLHCH